MGSSVFEFCHLRVKGQEALRPGPWPEEAAKAACTGLPRDLAPEQRGGSQGVSWDSPGVSGLLRMMLAAPARGKPGWRERWEGGQRTGLGSVSLIIKWE